MEIKTARRVLVIHLAGFGDLVMGLPALAGLRASLAKSKLVLLTWTRNAPLARLIPHVDSCVTLDPANSVKAVVRNIATLWRLRRERFDVAINLYNVYRRIGVVKLSMVLFVIAARVRVGRDTGGKGTCFTVKVPERFDETLHESEKQARVVRHLGLPCPAEAEPVVLQAEDGSRLKAWLAAQLVSADEPLVVVHPGSARKNHRWPWELFACVARAIEAQQKCRIVITGTAAEQNLAKQLARCLKRPVVAAGHLSIGELAWLLKKSRLLLTNDSGPMHLAANLQVPLVAVAGTSDPLRYGPTVQPRAGTVVLKAEGISSCYRYFCRGHAQLRLLSPSSVWETCRAVLEGRHPEGIVPVKPLMRILHVHTLSVISGSGLNTFLSMQGLPKDRFAVALACAPGGELIDWVESQAMPVYRLNHMVWAIHPLKDLLVIGELARLMRRGRYHLVHTHNSKAGFVGRLAARLAGVPAIVHTVHGFAFHTHEPRWKQRFYRKLEQMAAGWCDKLIFISQPLVDWAKKEHIGQDGQGVKIYSGIDLDAFRRQGDGLSLRVSLGLAADHLVIGEVAKLWKGKGHAALLQAVAALADDYPQLRLLLIGEGGLRGSLQALAQQLGIANRVIFTGFRSDIPALTQILDIAVLPSLFEGMGRAVIEAQAAGKPVVASRVGGILDLIEDGHTGLLVEPGDIEALAEALRKLCADAVLRRQLGEAAQRSADGRFAVQTMNRQIIQVYDELLSRN